MLHFSCDICHRAVEDERYPVSVEVTAEHDPDALTEADLDVDHLADLGEALDAGFSGHAVAPPPRRQTFRYDLCPSCADRYRRDPLGRDARRRLNFSEN